MNLVIESTTVLSEHAARIPDYFPDTQESRHGDVSDALPEIWNSWERFTKLGEQMQQAVIELRESAEPEINRKRLGLAMKGLAKSCSNCHEDYRKPKE